MPTRPRPFITCNARGSTRFVTTLHTIHHAGSPLSRPPQSLHPRSSRVRDSRSPQAHGPLATAPLPSHRCVRLPKRGLPSHVACVVKHSAVAACRPPRSPPAVAAHRPPMTHARTPYRQNASWTMDPSSTTVPSTYFFDPHMNLPQKSLHHNIFISHLQNFV